MDSESSGLGISLHRAAFLANSIQVGTLQWTRIPCRFGEGGEGKEITQVSPKLTP